MKDEQKSERNLTSKTGTPRAPTAPKGSSPPNAPCADNDLESQCFDIAGVMLVVVDTNERISRINRKACDILGLPPHQACGKNWFDHFVPPAIRAEKRRDFQDLAAGKQPTTAREEFAITTASGEQRTIAWRTSVLRIDTGQAVATILAGEDVTDQIKTEQALSVSEESFRKLVDTLVAAVFIYSGTSIKYVNATGVELTGYSSDEFKRMSFWDVIHPDHQPLVKERGLARQQDQEVPDRYEVRLQRKDGATRWVDFGASLIDFEGQPAVLGIAYDITNRVRAATALRESQRAMKTLMANLPGMAYRCRNDEQWTMEIVSEGCQPLTGYAQQDLLFNRKIAFADLIHPDDRCPVWDDVQAAIDRQTPFQLTYRIIDASGTVKWVLEQGRAVLDDNKSIVALEGFIIDITQRKMAEETIEQAKAELEQSVEDRTADLTIANRQLKKEAADRKHFEQQLRESSEQFAALADELNTLLRNTRDFVYRHNTEGVFTYLSPAVEQLTGYTVEDWKQHYTRYMTDSPLNRDVVSRTEETLRTGVEGDPYLVEIRHKAGHAVVLEVNERPFYEGRRVAGVVGVARDVTERLIAEEQLRQAKEAAEAASRAKTSFLGNISHEIRTPITAMLGAAELLARQPGTPDEQAGKIDIVLRNARHLLSMVDDLLSLSQIEADKLSVRPMECDLVELLADIEAIAAPSQPLEQIDFRIFYDSRLPATINTDPTRLRQAVTNLISNAFKFTTEGHIWLRLRTDECDENPMLVFSVEDTGIGIPQEHTQHIFEAFARLREQSNESAAGAGLGLPLAKWIAEQLGGSLTVESTAGTGSIFTLRIATGPLEGKRWIKPDARRKGDIHSDIDSAPPLEPILHGNILLAEDAKDTRDILTSALTSAGANVTAVENGEAAMTEIGRLEFDLILLDIRMPKKDGLTTAREMRAARVLTPIIALTASTTEGQRAKIIDAGFDDQWPKPISITRLIQAVSAYLDAKPHRTNKPAGEKEAKLAITTTNVDRRLSQVVRDFRCGLTARLDSLKQCVRRGDTNGVHDLLHQLVGASGIFGYMALSDEAARLTAILRTARAEIEMSDLRPIEKLITQLLDIPDDAPLPGSLRPEAMDAPPRQ